MGNSFLEGHALSGNQLHLALDKSLVQAPLVTLLLNDVGLKVIILAWRSQKLRMATGFQAIILLIRQLRAHHSIHDGGALLALIDKLYHRADGQAILSLLIHSQLAAALHLRHNNLRPCMAQVQLDQPCQHCYSSCQAQQPVKKSK